MAELNNKKLVNAEALAKVAKGVYEQVQADIDAVEEQIADASVFEIDMLTVSSTGGIKAGEDLNGMTVQQILTKLLYPHVDQEVGAVSTTPGASVREHGDYVKVSQVSANVTKKSNSITKVELYKDSTLIDTKTDMANGGKATFAGLSEDTVNGTKFTIKAYALGENGVEKAVSKSSAAFTYVYPYYQGIVAADAEVNADLVKGLEKIVKEKQDQTFSYTTSNQKVIYAFPKSYGELSSILDGNGFEQKAGMKVHTIDIVGLDGTKQAYYVYEDGVSSTSFKYTFKK